MHVYEKVVFVGQRHQPLNRFNAVISSEFEMGNATDHIGPQTNRLFHQLLALGK